jgi:hypothetical protein
MTLSTTLRPSKFLFVLAAIILFITQSTDVKAIYCVPSNPACGTSSYINTVGINGTTFLNQNTGCASLNGSAYSIYTPTPSTTATLNPGTTYQVTVTTFGASIVSMWIDYDQNQIFDASEWTQVSLQTTSGLPVVVSIIVPVNALSGATGMRLRTRISGTANGSTDACTAFGSGEAEDYTVTIANSAPCVAPPVAGNTISSLNQVCANNVFTLSLAGASTGAGLTYQWQSSSNNSSWTNILNATLVTYPTTQAVATYYRCAVTCAGQTSYSTSIYITLSTPIFCYCSSAATFNTLSDIGRVVLGSMTNGTAFPVTLNTTATNTYSNFTQISPTTLDIGATYPMSVHQITSGTINNNAYVIVYIDYNKDGVYTYPTEYSFLGATSLSSGGNVVNGTISIPSTATIGITGMRVILVENGNTTQSSCGSYFFGETEDYFVNLLPTQACVGQPSAGLAATSASSVCGNATFTLSLIGATSNSFVTHQWEYSPNNFSWLPVPLGATSIYTGTQSSSNYYRCKLTCSGISAYSSSIYIAYTPLSQCYCTSKATNPAFTDIGNVSIGGLSNGVALPIFSNSTATNIYTDFTTLPPITLFKGSQYPVSVSQILTSPGFFSAFGLIYIDYNKDGTFSPSETLSIGTTTNLTGGNILSSLIAVPLTADTGITRMRVILVEGGNAGQSPCGTYTYGETEDYLVKIENSSPCLVPPLAGITTANDTAVCSSDLLTLNLTGNSIGSFQTYTWQSSSNLINWSIIAFGNSFPLLTLNQTQARYYRCEVNCNGSISYSIPIFVNQNPILTCFCVSSALSTNDTDIGNVTIGTLSNGIALPVLGNPNANKTYTDFTSLPTTNLQRGGNYLLSISQITSGSSFFTAYGMAYIDFNADGVFGAGESYSIGQTSSNGGVYTISAYIIIPVTASLGVKRMRIVLSEGSIQPACGTYTYGETEDYTVFIQVPQACPVPVLGGLTVSNVSSTCAGAPIQLSLNGSSVIPTGSYNWQYSYDGIGYFSIPSALNPTYNTFQNQATFYRCYIACSNGSSAYSTPVYIPMTPINQCYCASSATFTIGADIGNVTIGTLNNGLASPTINNTNSFNIYTNFTALPPTNLELGTVSYISVSQISSNTFQTSFIAVFIDFNKNGVYDTLTERLSLGLTTAALGGNVRSGFIAIPSNAVLGLTGMRIVLRTGTSTLPTPCGTYSNGETEDYLVNIIPLQPCLSAPIAGNAFTSDTTICFNTNFVLSLQNNSTFASQTYQWQYSSDNITWTPITGATLPTYTGVLLGNSYYRCIISCSGFTVISGGVHLIQNPANECYCTSSALNTSDDDIGNVTFLALNNGVATPALNNPSSVNLYSDFTSLAPQAVILGAGYPIAVSQINLSGFFVAQITVYIDFNRNGVFEAGVETIQLGATNAAIGGNTLTGTINVPFTATPGITRMRIVLEEGSAAVTSPCGTYTWGETEDYSLLILQNQSCSNPPTPGNSNCTSSLTCQNSSFTLYITGNSSALGQYYQWQSSPDGLNWNSIGSISLDSSFIYSQTSATYYRCAVTCSGLTSYSVPVLVNMLQSPICGYCTNVGGTSCPSNTKITNVSISGTSLNNTDTTCYSINGSAVGVFPFGGNTTATIEGGNSYIISVTSTQNVSKSVWIDYDQNGSFSSNEWTQICTTSVAGVPDVAAINVPWGIPGGPTGMRVRTRINGPANGAGDACSFFGSGETEDYTLLVDIGNALNTIDRNEEIFSFYPNPAQTVLYIKVAASQNLNNKLFVYNSLGEMVLTQAILNAETKIDIGNLPRGMYLLNYQTDSKTYSRKLIIE